MTNQNKHLRAFLKICIPNFFPTVTNLYSKLFPRYSRLRKQVSPITKQTFSWICIGKQFQSVYTYLSILKITKWTSQLNLCWQTGLGHIQLSNHQKDIVIMLNLHWKTVQNAYRFPNSKNYPNRLVQLWNKHHSWNHIEKQVLNIYNISIQCNCNKSYHKSLKSPNRHYNWIHIAKQYRIYIHTMKFSKFPKQVSPSTKRT
jgi:hypothetical protein